MSVQKEREESGLGGGWNCEIIMYQDYGTNDERTRRYRRTVNVDGGLVIREMTLGTDKQTKRDVSFELLRYQPRTSGIRLSTGAPTRGALSNIHVPQLGGHIREGKKSELLT